MTSQIAAHHAPLGHNLLVHNPPPDAHFTLHQAACITQTAGGIMFGVLILIAVVYGIGVSLAITEAKGGCGSTRLVNMARVIALRAHSTMPWSDPALNYILGGSRWVEIAINVTSAALTRISSRMQFAGRNILRAYASIGWYGTGFHGVLRWLIGTGMVIEAGFTAVTMVLSALGIGDDWIMLLYGMELIEITAIIFAMLAAQSVSHILRERPSFALKWT